jgi:hypothetical protein
MVRMDFCFDRIASTKVASTPRPEIVDRGTKQVCDLRGLADCRNTLARSQRTGLTGVLRAIGDRLRTLRDPDAVFDATPEVVDHVGVAPIVGRVVGLKHGEPVKHRPVPRSSSAR